MDWERLSQVIMRRSASGRNRGFSVSVRWRRKDAAWLPARNRMAHAAAAAANGNAGECASKYLPPEPFFTPLRNRFGPNQDS